MSSHHSAATTTREGEEGHRERPPDPPDPTAPPPKHPARRPLRTPPPETRTDPSTPKTAPGNAENAPAHTSGRTQQPTRPQAVSSRGANTSPSAATEVGPNPKTGLPQSTSTPGEGAARTEPSHPPRTANPTSHRLCHEPRSGPGPAERIVGQRRRAVRAAQLVRCQPVAKLIPDQAGQTRKQTRIRIHLRIPQQPQPQPGAGNSTGCVRVIRPDLIPVVKRHPPATLRQPLHRPHTTRDGPRQPPRSQTQQAEEQATLPTTGGATAKYQPPRDCYQ